MSANDRQHGGTHYKDRPIQPWDFIVANGIGFLAGNVIKYVTRYKHKDGLSDLQKAQHYLEKLIETETIRRAPQTDGLSRRIKRRRKAKAFAILKRNAK